MRVTSSPAPAVTTACALAVQVDGAAADVDHERRGARARRRAGSEHRRVRLGADDVRAARRALGEHLQQAARVAPREHRERERAPTLQAPAQARILGRLRQAAPERVEHAFVRARRAAQRGHRARAGAAARARRAPRPCRRRRAGARSCRSSRPRGRPCPPRARRAPCAGPPPRARRDGRRAPRPARGRAARPA